MEQVRVVKEMREHDRNNGRTGEFIRPRYMVWENVPGALSSAGKGKPKGSDFQAVLTEITKIVKTDAPDVPIPDKGWTKSGTLMGVGDDGCPFSISYRLHDAQFWGVPQRRKRLALVADFGGLSAPEILFERKGLSGHFEESEGEEQAAAEGIRRSVDKPSCLNGWDVQSKHIQPRDGVAETLYSGESTWGGQRSTSTIAIEGNGSRSSHHGDGYREADKMYSLNTVEQHAVFADRPKSD